MIAIPSVVIIVLLLLKTFFPYKSKGDNVYRRGQTTVADDKKYSRYEVLSIFPLFLFIGLINLMVYWIGCSVQKLISSNIDYDFYIGPPEPMWALIGLLFGFGLVMLPMEWFYKLLLRGEYELYIDYTNSKHGWNGMKIMRPISIVLTSIGLVFFYLGLNYSFAVDKNYIIVDNFFSLHAVEYKVDEISSITYYDKQIAPNGEVVDKRHIKILFDDATFWSSDDLVRIDENETVNECIQYLLDKADLKLAYEEIDENQ